MTTREFSKEFDILYDNISSNSAPGINEYEKSVFLTRAQEELISQYYSGLNTEQAGFEGNENIRRSLAPLVEDIKIGQPFSLSTGKINDTSLYFEIPNDVFYIVFEQIQLFSETDECLNGKYIMVKPITHDEYNLSKDNPFRKPDKNKAWRLDVGKRVSRNVVEIITPYIFNVNNYHCRYIKQPEPIILTNFDSDPELEGLNLTIDGFRTELPCQLSPEIHREILNRAVEMAARAYRENTLQNNVQLNKNKV